MGKGYVRLFRLSPVLHWAVGVPSLRRVVRLSPPATDRKSVRMTRLKLLRNWPGRRRARNNLVAQKYF